MKAHTFCFVPGCKTGFGSTRKLNKENGIKNKSLFNVPKVLDLLSKWNLAIPGAHRNLEPNDVVCELHFNEEDIINYYETKMPDGSIFKLERGKKKLKAGAVPSIFPNLSKQYRSDHSSVCQTSPEQQKNNICCNSEDISAISNQQSLDICHDTSIDTETDSHVNDHYEIIVMEDGPTESRTECEFFTLLKVRLNEVALPKPRWSGSFVESLNAVIFLEWSKKYTVRKRVIIKEDSSIVVMVGNKNISVPLNVQAVTCFGDINTLLDYVDGLRLCKGLKDKSSSENCIGIIPPEELIRSRCSVCQPSQEETIINIQEPSCSNMKNDDSL